MKKLMCLTNVIWVETIVFDKIIVFVYDKFSRLSCKCLRIAFANIVAVYRCFKIMFSKE